MSGYTRKPSQPPAFDATGFASALATGKPITAAQQAQFIAWKRWLESSSTYDGVAKGGLRDVLNALALAVDPLKTGIDANTQAILELRAKVQALEEAPAARPFPEV